MLGYFTEEGSAGAVNARMRSDIDPRLAEIMACLVGHLHAFAKEIRLTQEEWEMAIDFLTRTGKTCSDQRQEFILLSDTLGFSMLVDAINNRRPPGATENTVFGPFHVQGAPVRQMGDNICLDGKGESCLYEGRVIDLDGNPIAGAHIDVWSDNADGFYDVQQPDIQPRWNNRGIFVTGPDGTYRFTGIKPVSYPIPDDGPVGQMLGRLGRHPYRPAHMHFLVTAEGHQKLVTHTFVGDDPYLASDAVFGVKESLVAPFERLTDGPTLWRSTFDFVLVPEAWAAAPGALPWLEAAYRRDTPAAEAMSIDGEGPDKFSIDPDRVDDAVLALLRLGRHGYGRVWKTIDWDAMDRLCDKGFISNPANKAKSVELTAAGEARSRQLLYELFGRR